MSARNSFPTVSIEVPPALITAEALIAKKITTVPQLVSAIPELSTPSVVPVK